MASTTLAAVSSRSCVLLLRLPFWRPPVLCPCWSTFFVYFVYFPKSRPCLSLWGEISAGRLKARKRGQRTIILCADLKHWVESFPRASYRPAQPEAAPRAEV